MPVLKHVKCSWASLIEPNTKFEPCYEIVAHLSEEQAKPFIQKGIKVVSEDGELLLRFKSKVIGQRKDGTTYEKKKPILLDAALNPYEGGLIGNGSVVNIQYSFREWTMAGNSGVKADLEAVQVIELVPYGGKIEFEDEGETVVRASDEDSPTNLLVPEDTPY